MRLKPNTLWIALFGVWLLFLTGFLGTPGVAQAIRLNMLYSAKQAQIEAMQDHLLTMQAESVALEQSKTAQEREIRRVLGYAASDELIFDFTNSEEIASGL